MNFFYILLKFFLCIKMKTSNFGCEIEFVYTYKERQPQPGTHFNTY